MAIAIMLVVVVVGSILFHVLSPWWWTPIGKPVKMLLRSAEVLHDFHVPEFRAKMDMIPGMVTYFWFTPTRTGEFEILCAELCGTGHPHMRGFVVIDTEEDFKTWESEQDTFRELMARATAPTRLSSAAPLREQTPGSVASRWEPHPIGGRRRVFMAEATPSAAVRIPPEEFALSSLINLTIDKLIPCASAHADVQQEKNINRNDEIIAETHPPARRATYQDVLDAPPNKVAEVIAGTLHMQPRPAAPHARALSILGMEVGSTYDRGRSGPGGWWIIFEPELHLAEDIVVPDLAGWRRETMPDYPVGAYFDIAPDWVCEVLSPSTRGKDLGGKRDVYRREGVGHLWFVDPEARTLEAFELRDGKWVLLAALTEAAPVSLPPFDAITFPLDALWAGTAASGAGAGNTDEPAAPDDGAT